MKSERKVKTENMVKHIDLVMAAAYALHEVGDKIGACGLLAVIGTAIDEFATKEGIGEEGAREMIERLLSVQDNVWNLEGDFYGGGSQWKD